MPAKLDVRAHRGTEAIIFDAVRTPVAKARKTVRCIICRRCI